MKARVKATGKVIQVMNVIDEKGNSVWEEISDMTNHCPQYSYDELEFDDIPKDIQKEKRTEPDYWEKLKHQYAGMAMQGWLSNTRLHPYRSDEIAECSYRFATALINKLKEEEK